MPRVEFVFDVSSPYSYLASTQVPALVQRTGAELVLVPVALGGMKKAIGVEDVPPAARLAYMAKDLALWAARYGVPFEIPSSWPTRTILPQRAIVAAGQGRAGLGAMAALFRAHWAQGKDVSEPAVVKAALDEAGLDGAALLARAEEQPIKDALRANTDRAVSRGVFGVPTFFAGDEMFWGNDRLDFVEAALRK